MGEYAEMVALQTYGYSMARTEIHKFDPVVCPVCEKEFGGKSGFSGEQGRLEGVNQHMKFKHGIAKKWEREALIDQPPTETPAQHSARIDRQRKEQQQLIEELQ